MSNLKIPTELKSHFLRLYQMALSDDQFDIMELKLLYQFADERGVPKEELDRLLLNPVYHSTSIPQDIQTRIEELSEYLLDCVKKGISKKEIINQLSL